jgi:hypothetical protein
MIQWHLTSTVGDYAIHQLKQKQGPGLAKTIFFNTVPNILEFSALNFAQIWNDRTVKFLVLFDNAQFVLKQGFFKLVIISIVSVSLSLS